MTDFSSLPRLAQSDLDIWNNVKAAFDGLRDCMRRQPFFAAEVRTKNYGDMVTCIDAVYAALKRANSLDAIMQWETSGTGHEAKQLLEMGQGAADWTWPAGLLGKMTELEPGRWLQVRNHIASFADAVLEALRPVSSSPLPTPQPSIDSTPDYPPLGRELVEAAAETLRHIFRNLPNELFSGATKPGHGQRLARADRLVSAVAEAGHEPAAAAWAIHQCVEAGALLTEIRNVDVEVGGHEEIDRDSISVRAREYFGDRMNPPKKWVKGRMVATPTYAGTGPVPLDCLLVRSTQAFWSPSVSTATRGSEAPKPRCKTSDASPRYVPNEREPKTFGELLAFATAWAAFNSNNANLSPPVIATDPDHHFLEMLCVEKFGSMGLEPLGRLRAKYAVETGKTVDEIHATSLGEMAGFFRPRNDLAAPLTKQGRPAEKNAGTRNVAHSEATPAALALMRVLTNGLADDRIASAVQVLAMPGLTVNEKLTKIDGLIPLPATASAEQLGEMLGKSKQAVLKTDWWTLNRKGEKEEEIGRRREGHRKRAKGYEPPNETEDDK